MAAYSWFASQFGKDVRLCVLGHSMGNGPLLEELANFRPAPSCVVIGNAFSSLRDEGKRSLRGPLRLLLYVMPDEWNNVKNVSHDRVPLLLIHSDADIANPVSMGKRIFDAAPEPKRMIVVHGFKHNVLYTNPREGWWDPVLHFLKAEPIPDYSGTPSVPQADRQ